MLTNTRIANSGASKRRLAPSGSGQRETKSRKRDDTLSNQGLNRGESGGPYVRSGGNTGVLATLGMGEDPFGRQPKREEFADQKLMDDIKKGMVILYCT